MKSFDERAIDWDSDPAKVERARAVAEAIRAAVPLKPGMSAFEYGCGTGLLSFALQADFASITLADNSEGMLDVLAGKIERAGIGNMHPMQLDLTNEPYPDKRFDVLTSLMTLHHIPNTELVLGQFNALLNPGGWLCISDLEKEDGSFHGQQVTDVHRGFERSVLQQQANAAGFGRVKFSSVFPITKPVDGREKVFPVFLMVARKNSS